MVAFDLFESSTFWKFDEGHTSSSKKNNFCLKFYFSFQEYNNIL